MNKSTDIANTEAKPLAADKVEPSKKAQPAEKSAEQKRIASEFLTLTNEFASFSADCAFLCEAFAAIASEQQHMDDFNVYGFNRYSLWLKEQVVDFNQRIEQLQQNMRSCVNTSLAINFD